MASIKSRTGLYATSFFAIGSFFITLAFVSPYWLVNDGVLKDARFKRIGLWEVCFSGYIDDHHWYDTIFNDCWWIFEEEYYIIYDFLFPSFFIATQFFFTMTMCSVLGGIALNVMYFRKEKDYEKFVTLLVTLGTVLILGGLCGLIAVITFGARGDGRDWMPHWEHNDMGWSFALACIGIFFEITAGILFIVEARVRKYKKLHEMQSRDPSAYSMQERKIAYVGGHTDI